MKVDEWLTFFKQHHTKKLFSLSDLEILTKKSKKNLSVQLNRLTKAEILKRPVRGWYENPFNPPSLEEITMVLRPPSYLSMEYALYKHDIISQQIHILTLVTTKLPYTYKTKSHILEYHQLKKTLFWGFEKHDNVHIANPEKALLDFIYLRSLPPRSISTEQLYSFIDSMYLEELDIPTLQQYITYFGPRTKDYIAYILSAV
jgi:hypothetical protein